MIRKDEEKDMKEYDLNKVSGLSNIGNSCFINASFQLLFASHRMSTFLLEYGPFVRMTRLYFDEKTLSMTPEVIHNGQPGDPHEFLTKLFDHVKDSLKTQGVQDLSLKTPQEVQGLSLKGDKNSNDKKAFYRSLLYTPLETTVQCQVCQYSTSIVVDEPITSISLNHPDLASCLMHYFQEEELTDWQCDRCHQHQAIKRNKIKALPIEWVIHQTI